jgi:hypothetical protein
MNIKEEKEGNPSRKASINMSPAGYTGFKLRGMKQSPVPP